MKTIQKNNNKLEEKNSALSIVIPVLNEEESVQALVERIAQTAFLHTFIYEIIFVDDHSTDKTQEIITNLMKEYPLSLYLKKGKKGKAQSLIEGFSYAKYDMLCMIDADLQYPPESIPKMMKKIEKGADIVVAKRKDNRTGFTRKTISRIYTAFFNKLMHHFDCDVQSGLKVFRKEILQRIQLHPSSWTFDLEFLIKARNCGYQISSQNIVFYKRITGKAKLSLVTASMQIGWSALTLKLRRSEIIPFPPEVAKIKGLGFYYKGKEFIHHSPLHHSKTAFFRLSGMQIFVLVCSFIVLLEFLILDWHTTLVGFICLLTIVYFADLLFNLYLVYRSFSKPAEIQIAQSELTSTDDRDWPQYTVLCPLYKEAHVLPQFVNAMNQLDYPKDKLQIMLLLEENDTETIEKARMYDLPSYFDIVIVPHSLPKTKPKACNYGLLSTKGEYVVIFDAEDAPDPLQLKKTVLAFQKADEKTVCIQAKLNFYNPHQNLLTRIFTAEYSLWFDLVLTGLQSIHAPIPLGGTSNHFRTAELIKLKGWDSFNVTEDCDLGMRLVKEGYQTAIVDSETLEEANSALGNWFWQRTRWIKGYMQTYLIHMRNPKEFITDWSRPHVITFQLIVGGKILSMFVNPLMWFITICYFLFRAHIAGFIESFFPTSILYMAVLSLLVGNFLYVYYYILGCAKHGHHELIKYVIFVPFYWLAMSVAGWVAFYKLITAPHHWAKTKHGLHLHNKKTIVEASITLEIGKIYKPTVSIDIPAYNEENNIANLLKQILAQKQKGFVIEEINVISDGSKDNTAKIARQYADKGVKVIEYTRNQGLTYRQNEIISKTTTDILVLLNADILLGNKNAISSLVAPILSGADISAQYARPVAPRTFMERILHAGFELKYFVYTHHKKGNNIYTCVGHMRALSRKFYSQVTFPEASEGEDQYLYLACIKGGYVYQYAHAVKSYFKLPDNFTDYKRYAKRIFQTQKKYGEVFSEKLARSERKLPLSIKVIGCMYAFVKNPLYTPLYVILHIVMQQWALRQPENSSSVYEISKSTKLLHYGQFQYE